MLPSPSAVTIWLSKLSLNVKVGCFTFKSVFAKSSVMRAGDEVMKPVGSTASLLNLNLITRYVEGDKKTIRQVRSKALLTAFLIIILSVIIYFVFRLLIGVTAWTWTLLIDMFKWLIGLF